VALACNIDARGKVARLRIGIGLAVIGLLLTLSWALPFGGVAAWLVSGAVLLAAAFSIFEARAGWCVARAMGFKTPI
jgi:hypothetical protein